jgi:hypothetical protein
VAITDSFTGTNGTGIEAYSSNWAFVRNTNADDLQIQSNGVSYRNVAGAEISAQRTESDFPGDHYAQVTQTTTAGVTNLLGVAVRCQGADSQDYYGLYAADTITQMFENDGATWTQEGSDGGGLAAGQTIRLTISGTTLTPAINGATQSPPGVQTNATFSGGAPGLSAFNDGGAAGQLIIDDFESTDAGPQPLKLIDPAMAVFA